MPGTRLFVGLAVAARADGVDAALVRVGGSGLESAATVEHAVRTRFRPDVRDDVAAGRAAPRAVGDALATATRQLVAKAGIDLRQVLAAGLIADDSRFPAAAEWAAEKTGVTVVSGFAARDVAAGGSGSPVTAAADFVLFHGDAEDRLLIHAGATAAVLFVPAGGRPTDMVGFDAGPGHALADAVAFHGSRGKDISDATGTKAVQGKCLDDLLANWLAAPHFARRPPKAIPASEYGPAFLAKAFEDARGLGGSIHDLLCTVTHLTARGVGLGCRRWVPPPTRPRRIFVSGDGTRNGFLWQLLQAQFPGETPEKLDALGTPPLARTAAGAAVLAGLVIDGATGNLPLLTGASGGRLLGRLVPGDPRNWAAVAARAGEQLLDYLPFNRAA